SPADMPRVAERIQLAVDQAFAPGLITVSYDDPSRSFQFVSTTGKKLDFAITPNDPKSIFAVPTVAGAHFNLNADNDADTKRPAALVANVPDLTILSAVSDNPGDWSDLEDDRSFSLTFRGVTEDVRPNFTGAGSMDAVAGALQLALRTAFADP